jgi:hypothetical protein
MQLMSLSAPKLQINQLSNPKADHSQTFSIRLLYCDVTFHFNLVFLVNWFPRRQKNDDGLGIQVQLVSMYIIAFWTYTVSFSSLLVETATKVTNSILYQFVNTWTHWVLIRWSSFLAGPIPTSPLAFYLFIILSQINLLTWEYFKRQQTVYSLPSVS